MLYIIFPSYTCIKNTAVHTIYSMNKTPPPLSIAPMTYCKKHLQTAYKPLVKCLLNYCLQDEKSSYGNVLLMNCAENFHDDRLHHHEVNVHT